MKYRHCIFDLYGTLVDIHTDEAAPGLWEKMTLFYQYYGAVYTAKELRDDFLRIVHQKEEELRQQHRASPEVFPEMQIETVFLELYRQKGVQATPDLAVRVGEIFRENSREYLQLYEGVTALLHNLRKNGQKVYLLSNAQRIFTQPELKALGLLEEFDDILLSSDYGCRKPDRRFFDTLLQRWHINPAEAIMIGNDAACDIAGAREAGIASLYIRSNLSPDEPLPQADYVLESMDLLQVQKILTTA